MKVEIIIDENLDESLVKIYAPSYNEDVENIKRSLESTNINMLALQLVPQPFFEDLVDSHISLIGV